MIIAIKNQYLKKHEWEMLSDLWHLPLGIEKIDLNMFVPYFSAMLLPYSPNLCFMIHTYTHSMLHYVVCSHNIGGFVFLLLFKSKLNCILIIIHNFYNINFLRLCFRSYGKLLDKLFHFPLIALNNKRF